MDTVGTLVGKLTTVGLKLWNAQDKIYRIRKMSFDEFDKEMNNRMARLEIYEFIKAGCDLNVQRNQLMDEIDSKIVDLINQKVDGKDLDDGNNIQRAHKNY